MPRTMVFVSYLKARPFWKTLKDDCTVLNEAVYTCKCYRENLATTGPVTIEDYDVISLSMKAKINYIFLISQYMIGTYFTEVQKISQNTAYKTSGIV